MAEIIELKGLKGYWNWPYEHTYEELLESIRCETGYAIEEMAPNLLYIRETDEPDDIVFILPYLVDYADCRIEAYVLKEAAGKFYYAMIKINDGEFKKLVLRDDGSLASDQEISKLEMLGILDWS